jgi:AcrR family transcriptional regulator
MRVGISKALYLAVPQTTSKPADPPQLPTRERLIESARFLFWDRGYAGTSMADLLAHARVNSGSFYHFFESKEALLREVLTGYLAALRPMVVDPAFATTEDPIGRIFAILAGYRERILSTESRYGCPLGRLALEIDPENRPAHALIAENFSGWIAAVRECLLEASTVGRIPPGTDLDALATYVLAVMEGGVMLSRSYGSVDPFDRTVAQLNHHFRLLTQSPPTTLSAKKKRSPKRQQLRRLKQT